MGRYILRRTLHAIALVVLILVISFALLHIAPGDVASRYVDAGVAPADIARVRTSLGLDDPLPQRLVRWMSAMARGDFGVSLVDQRPVADMLGEAIPRTLLLTGLAFLLQVMLGMVIGVTSATRRRSKSDSWLRGATFALYALPSFYLAYLLITVFALDLRWFPSGGIRTIGADLEGWRALLDRMRHLVLPVCVLGSGGAAVWARFTRGALLDELGRDYIRVARARGVDERRAVRVHALRGAMPQLVTLAGVTVPFLLGGAVVVEKVFAWPGMGALLVDAIYARDYPVVLAANLLAATFVVLANLVADLGYGLFDPRMKLADVETAGQARSAR